MLPFIIISSAYLIIPYPRLVVLLIQTLPAVAVKFVLPHLLHHSIPNWAQPAVILIGWGIIIVITRDTPPTISPPPRIVAVVFASVLSAAGDVFWLGSLGRHGKPSLQGWGVGTGLGLAVCAVLPYFVTVVMDQALRDSIAMTYYLVPTMILSHWFLLPTPVEIKEAETAFHPIQEGHGKDVERFLKPVAHDHLPSLSLTSPRRLRSNLKLLVHLTYPFILPLILCSAGQTMTYSAFSRVMAVTPTFDRYTAYLALYGLVFQLGNLVGRSSLLVARTHKTRVLITTMVVGAGLVLLNAIFLFASTTLVVFPLVFAIGVSVGLVYIETFAAAVEEPSFKSRADKEFSLGSISVGEPVGLLLGGLVGSALEMTLCGLDLSDGQRWCHTTA